MKKNKQITAIFLSLTLALGLSACSNGTDSSSQSDDSSGSSTGQTTSSTEQTSSDTGENIEPSVDPERAYIEQTLNLAYNEEQEWTYSKDSDAWTLSIVSAVAYPELPDQQGVSVCVPGAYVSGIDTDGDGNADVTAQSVSNAVKLCFECRLCYILSTVKTEISTLLYLNLLQNNYQVYRAR